MSYPMTASSRHMSPAMFDELSDVALRIMRLERSNYSDHEQQAILALLHLRWENLNSRDRSVATVSETGTILNPPLTTPITNESGNDSAGQTEVEPQTALTTSNTDTSSGVMALLAINSQSSEPRNSEHQTQKRKRDDDAKDVASKTSGSQIKKPKTDDNSKKRAPKPKRRPHAEREREGDGSLSNVLGHHFKEAVTARNGGIRKGDYEAVNDAFLPDNNDGAWLPRTAVSVNGVTAWESAEQVGDLTGLHPQEIWLCRQLNITDKVYRCQKARVFLGMALFAEYNRQQCRTHPDKPQFLNMGRAQSQLFGNIDANKLSAMHVAFTAWGWMEAHRRKLVQEVFDWERGNSELPRDKWVATF
ncbi:hypothetical protein LTS15_002582 [Exophiala xenobiotica]|nr:hypothetical protein LTS15_002582 [Exophiala xenobiotica]